MLSSNQTHNNLYGTNKIVGPNKHMRSTMSLDETDSGDDSTYSSQVKKINNEMHLFRIKWWGIPMFCP